MSDARYDLTISQRRGGSSPKCCPKQSPSRRTSSSSGPLLDNPHRVGKRLLPPVNDRHSARRGTYRVLYRIDDAEKRVTIVAVVSRPDAYRSP